MGDFVVGGDWEKFSVTDNRVGINAPATHEVLPEHCSTG